MVKTSPLFLIWSYLPIWCNLQAILFTHLFDTIQRVFFRSQADSKASDPGTMVAKRPGSITTDSIQHARGRDSRTVHRRGSSDDEAAAKPMSRRVPGSPPGSTMRTSGTERRGNSDRGARCGEMKHDKCAWRIRGVCFPRICSSVWSRRFRRLD